MKWRFVDLGAVDPYYGPAAFEAVMDACSKGLAPDTIMFWRPNKPAVYVGYHQLVCADVNVEKCREMGVPIVRRVLGGGSGFCDTNQIIYNVIYKEGRCGMPVGPRGVYRVVLGGLVAALRLLGIQDAEIDEERFSVYANGKKISGSGQLTSGGVVNSSGSFLVDFDCDEMSKFLKDPVKNLKEGVRRPEDGLTSIRRETGRAGMQEVMAALLSGLEGALGAAERGELTVWEVSAAQGLIAKYRSHEWLYRADDRNRRRRNGNRAF